jgi:hypothetical protein
VFAVSFKKVPPPQFGHPKQNEQTQCLAFVKEQQRKSSLFFTFTYRNCKTTFMKSSLPQKRIFISYRVQDTAGETGRLVDALRTRFSDEQLFLDIDNLEPGADFSEVIEKYLDSCDVFLAVIGPHWIGDREENQPRIQDANDWVRMEVATALRRNVRVVPVLVDGGTLPKPEQLPDDLQSLLRRQAIEISNKRWRYDTDQLIEFLVTKIGIPPKKLTTTTPQTPPSRRKIWPYVAGGFALCLIILVVIGSLMNEDAKNTTAGTSPSYSAGSKQQPEETVPQKVTASDDAAMPETNNITGSWLEDDEGEKSTFVMRQNGSAVNVVLQAMGQNIATGSGVINGRAVVLNMPLFGVPTVVHLTLSADGRQMSGTYLMQSTGVAENIRLNRLGD